MPTNHVTILGTLASGEDVPLLQADRRRHVYLIGMTGTGKTGLLLNMMHADLLSGAGFCFLDPHADACQHIASLAPRERGKDVIYLDPSDSTHTFAYNPLSGVAEAERATAAANIVSAFKNIWAQSWGPRLEHILGHSLRLLLDTKDQTLLGLPRLLVDETYRDWLVVRCNDPVVRSFWQSEYAAYDTRLRNEAIAPIQNKIGAFLANPFIRSILCQTNNFQAWAKLMRDGVPSEPRLIKTFPPPFPGLRLEQVLAFTRSTHMMPRKQVEERIAATFPKAPAKRARHKGKRNADIG